MSSTATRTDSETWRDPTWRRAAEAWIDQQLARHGRRRAGEIEQVHARAWSLAWRVPTQDGPVWFKANGGQTRYEAPLAEALARWAPDRVLAPIAVHRQLGWQLMPDGGSLLRHSGGDDLRRWEAMVAEYARLQRDLASHADKMVALGVPDHRPDLLPGRVSELVDDPATPFTTESRDRLRALLPEYARWCARLAESGIAPSLNHDDLHDGNVFVRGGSFCFFDWGDSAVCHPFTVLLVALRVLAYRFELSPDDAKVLRVRDAYLDVYSDLADVSELRELARLATWTGKPARAMSWRRALAGATDAELGEHADAVTGWAEEVFEQGPL